MDDRPAVSESIDYGEMLNEDAWLDGMDEVIEDLKRAEEGATSVTGLNLHPACRCHL